MRPTSVHLIAFLSIAAASLYGRGATLTPADPAEPFETASGTTEPADAFVAIPDKPLIVTLVRASIDPTSLAAAGVPDAAVDPLVDRVRSWMTEHPDLIETADDTVGAARQAVHILERRVRSGLATPGELDSLSGLHVQLADALTARRNVCDSTFAAALDGLTEQPAESLTMIRSRLDDWPSLGRPYQVVDMEQSPTLALRDALAAERTAAEYDHELDDDAAQTIATVESMPAVQAALISESVSLTAIQGAWDAATAVQD